MGQPNPGEIIKQINLILRDLNKAPKRSLRLLRRAVVEIDRYYDNHTSRVCNYALRIGKKLNLSKSELINLEASALLHDLGKICVDKQLNWT